MKPRELPTTTNYPIINQSSTNQSAKHDQHDQHDQYDKQSKNKNHLITREYLFYFLLSLFSFFFNETRGVSICCFSHYSIMI